MAIIKLNQNNSENSSTSSNKKEESKIEKKVEKTETENDCINKGWNLIKEKKFNDAIEYLNEKKSYFSNYMLELNLAHAYLLIGKIDAAKMYYTNSRSNYMIENGFESTGKWKEIVKKDFEDFKSWGIQCDKYNEIINYFD